MSESLPIRFLDGPDGRRVAYTVHGRGPWLVCPAWWISHLEEDWQDPGFRRFFGGLGEVRTVVRYDRPGVGMSGRSEVRSSLELEVALVEMLYEQVGAETADLFAMSSAGPPSLEFARRHPGSVERLVLCGSYASGATIATPEVRRAMRTLVEAHWGLGSEALADIFHPGASAEARASWGRRQRRAADGRTASELLGLTYSTSAEDAAASVGCPTLVVHRRGDRAIPFEAGRRLAAALPNATLVALDGKVHLPWVGQDVLDVVLEFFGSEPRRRSPVESESAWRHDRSNRELIVDGERRALTPLEHRLLAYLEERAGRVVTRDEALRDVWEQPFAGSNVVDAVIRGLRRKLGAGSASIETVKGHGYRLRSGS